MAKDSQRGSSADDERELPDEPTTDDARDASDDELVDEDADDIDADQDADDSDDDDSDDEGSDGDESDDGADLDDEADGDDGEVVPPARRGKQSKTSAMATKKKPTRSQKSARAAKSSIAGAAPGTFLQQVVNELSKVVWPTRKQMVTYTTVVLVFVVLLVASVWGFDLGVGKVMDWIFA